MGVSVESVALADVLAERVRNASLLNEIRRQIFPYAHANDWSEVIEYDPVPTEPVLKTHYRVEDPYSLYRDFDSLASSVQRQHV